MENIMPSPAFDSDGYPTDETLAYIENRTYVNGEQDLWSMQQEMLDFAMSCWHWPKYATKRKCKDRCDVRYRFVTGGWSGNESVIRALRKNLWLSCAWRMSTSSGLHIFEVPIVSNAKV